MTGQSAAAGPSARITYDKLVRDRIPEVIEADGGKAVTRVLNEEEFRGALLAKLVEESEEARDPGAQSLPTELADVLEVLQAAVAAIGLTWDDLTEIAARKRADRGGFDRRLFLEYVEQTE